MTRLIVGVLLLAGSLAALAWLRPRSGATSALVATDARATAVALFLTGTLTGGAALCTTAFIG